MTGHALADPAASEPVALSDSDSETKREQAIASAQQVAAISAMFDDSDGEPDANSKGSVATVKEHDSQLLTNNQPSADDEIHVHSRPEDADQTPTPQMDFMDEESARNYQRILENSKRERAERRRTFRASGSIRNNDTSPTTTALQDAGPVLATNRLSPPTKEPSVSTDELPDDPLADNARPPRHTTPSKRKRLAPLRICDSEASDDSEVLDEHRILDQRLRTKPKLSSAMPNRFQQARLNMERETYASDSDNDDQSSIGAYESEDGAGAVVDPLDTDSESERVFGNSVMVIRGSSDEEEDAIVDSVEPRPLYTRVAGSSKDDKKRLDTFISQFEAGRRKQMQRKLSRKSELGHPQQKSPGGAPKIKGYSQDLDDDIADFIVDDDDPVVSLEDPARHATGGGSSESDTSERPRLGKNGPRGVMALMPDEFSLFDLHTSFKTYVQYLVYWICNDHKKPKLNEFNSQYFFQAYIAVARIIDSVEQSVVASSAWVEPFRSSLHSYPDYAACSIMGTPGCDACHFHSNRTATFCVTLSGTPYKRTILTPPRPGEPVTEDDTESGEVVGASQSEVVTIDDDSDEADNESDGQLCAEYNLGRTCQMRSEICHELHHYLYNLAHAVEIHLETLDYESIEGKYREEVTPDDLVDMLDTQGDIDRLFQQFKDTISRAKSGFTS
ncbi:hypothetical protein IWW39_005718 [Coemansia spiralis]|uniref:DUF4211 domain-containing protein n=1 Tax=Coemansia spiralis TaxID=417178 RepID=A0A9W8GGJ8_9FUNG|nr:hypothetical protein IWW39_005718 [Coemansia spiralis]